MIPRLRALFSAALAALGLLAAPLLRAEPGPLVDVQWLAQARAAGDVLVLDAQPAKLGDAAINYTVFQLMGYRNLRVLLQ